MLNEYFKTTDCENLKITPQQGAAIKKDFQLVKGSDYYKGIYDVSVASNIQIRYYQIATFEEFGKRAIRSFLFNGVSSKGACFFDYKIIELKDYNLKNDKINNFIKFLDKEIKEKKNNIKVMYKFYPVYNFKFTSPPNGNDLSGCVSELLN